MSSVEEVATAVRQVAAHEVRIEMLTARMDEVRDHLDQAGWRLQAAGAHIQASGDMSVYVKFTLSKEMMPDNFNGSHEVLSLEVQDVELLECWTLRARGRHHGVDRAGTGGCSRGQV